MAGFAALGTLLYGSTTNSSSSLSSDLICRPVAMADVDPLEHVTPSQAGDFGDMIDHQHEQHTPGLTGIVPGSDINLTLTSSGMRTLLGRKQRPRPLLRLVCTGCQLSTHDPDLFIEGDFMECLS